MHLNRLPKRTPPLADMLHDIGNPPIKAVAKALGMSPRTIYHWLQTGEAPRTASIALFWLTRWGQQWLDADLHNFAMGQAGLARSLASQLGMDVFQRDAATPPVMRPHCRHCVEAQRLSERPNRHGRRARMAKLSPGVFLDLDLTQGPLRLQAQRPRLILRTRAANQPAYHRSHGRAYQGYRPRFLAA